MNVLGLKVNGHDTGAAVFTGRSIVAIAEERLTRIKHSPNIFPTQSVAYCLAKAGITPAEVHLIVYDVAGADELDVSEEDVPTSVVRSKLGPGFEKTECARINHHDAHAAAAFFCSPFEESAVLIYDGRGSVFVTKEGAYETETETLYEGKGIVLKQIAKTLHPRSATREDRKSTRLNSSH